MRSIYHVVTWQFIKIFQEYTITFGITTKCRALKIIYKPLFMFACKALLLFLLHGLHFYLAFLLSVLIK